MCVGISINNNTKKEKYTNSIQHKCKTNDVKIYKTQFFSEIFNRISISSISQLRLDIIQRGLSLSVISIPEGFSRNRTNNNKNDNNDLQVTIYAITTTLKAKTIMIIY